VNPRAHHPPPQNLRLAAQRRRLAWLQRRRLSAPGEAPGESPAYHAEPPRPAEQAPVPSEP